MPVVVHDQLKVAGGLEFNEFKNQFRISEDLLAGFPKMLLYNCVMLDSGLLVMLKIAACVLEFEFVLLQVYCGESYIIR